MLGMGVVSRHSFLCENLQYRDMARTLLLFDLTAGGGAKTYNVGRDSLYFQLTVKCHSTTSIGS